MKVLNLTNLKTYENWKGDLHKYLEVGDVVDQEMVNHFLNVMPPACHTSGCIQIGEPYNHINGKAVFATLKRTEFGWVYAGHCYRGEVCEAI